MKSPDFELSQLGIAGHKYEGAEEQKVAPHIPWQLKRQEEYGQAQIIDERNFLYYGKPLANYEKEIATMYAEGREQKGLNIFREGQEDIQTRRIVQELATSLGRTPTPAEVECEDDRRHFFKQVDSDFLYDPASINKYEVFPQQEIIENRKDDFPEAEHALAAFRDGDAYIEEKDGITRLIIAVPNKEGKIVEHPVMTNEEIKWVKDSATAIAQSLEGKENKKVFIGGLGLGLLNRELTKLGISDQVVAELNPKVINLISQQLLTEYPEMSLNIREGEIQTVLQKALTEGEQFGAVAFSPSTEQTAQKSRSAMDLDIRQGDFKDALLQSIKSGEQFDAISIDAFPNTAEDVNRDGFNDNVFNLAYKALRPGGMITFYPDSRYLPLRVLDTLEKMGVPKSSIHYVVSKFNTSEFTKSYHYGDLMAVPMIQKPLLNSGDEEGGRKIQELVADYYKTLDKKAEEYVDKYLPKERLKEAA